MTVRSRNYSLVRSTVKVNSVSFKKWMTNTLSVTKIEIPYFKGIMAAIRLVK